MPILTCLAVMALGAAMITLVIMVTFEVLWPEGD